MTVASATVCFTAYSVDGEKRVLLYVSVYDAAAVTNSDIAAAEKKTIT